MRTSLSLARRALAVVGLTALFVVAGGPAAGAALPGAQASAAAKPARTAPQGPAKVRFAADFPTLTDAEWPFRIGGFGGVRKGAPLAHVPVILVHGNNVDHADWYPVRDTFKKAGWTDQELWALSYNGLGANNGSALFTANPERDAEHRELNSDGVTRVTENDVNVPDLYSFIMAVRTYTGSAKFSLVGHSLGVTLARKTLKVHPELRADLVAFVGIAGANHGTTFCPPGSEGNVVSCDEIAAGTPWLAELNGAGGADETYGPAKWQTIYDGSGAGDPAFVGPTYAQSPLLRGAENKQFPGTYHNDLRLDPAIVPIYKTFLETAEVPYRAAAAAGADAVGGAGAGGVAGSSGRNVAAAGSAGALAATGPADPTAPLIALAVIALALASRHQARPHRTG